MSSPIDVAGAGPTALSVWAAAGLYGVPAREGGLALRVDPPLPARAEALA